MKMKASHTILAAILAVAPISSASAHEGWHRDGPIIGLFALGAAAVVGTVAVLTAPVRAVAAVPAPGYYAPPGYAPQPAYYAPPQAYYAPAPVYYAAPPVYYAAPRGYYYGR